jgi:hypothetical protein
MEKREATIEAILALKNDKSAKAWIGPNHILFKDSTENRDMFLTTYRIRNAYEELLNKLEVNDEVTEDKDMTLIKRFFDMMFYPPRKMSISDWKNGRDPIVKIVKAYKDTRWKGNRRRKHEITLLLDDGKKVQLNPGDILNRFFHIWGNFDSLINSKL